MLKLKEKNYFGISKRALYTFDIEALSFIINFWCKDLYKDIVILDKNTKNGQKIGHELSEYLKKVSS